MKNSVKPAPPTEAHSTAAVNCPCRKHTCPRRLDCAACRKYHYEKNGLPRCER